MLDILKNLHGKIVIPKAVYEEIEYGKDKEYYQNLSKIEWIDIQEIQNIHSLKYFLDLDAGEAEAIVLATETNADLIIMDEKLGRYHAKHASLKVTGTIGVLLKAKSNGLIKEIRPLLFELMKKDVWLSENLINNILIMAGEK
jgi:predicted nucleic acid-binding protein